MVNCSSICLGITIYNYIFNINGIWRNSKTGLPQNSSLLSGGCEIVAVDGCFNRRAMPSAQFGALHSSPFPVRHILDEIFSASLGILWVFLWDSAHTFQLKDSAHGYGLLLTGDTTVSSFATVTLGNNPGSLTGRRHHGHRGFPRSSK